MELETWRVKLKPTGLRVHGALTRQLLQQVSQRSGDAAFLSYEGESGPPSDTIGVTRQLVTTRVLVTLRVTNVRGADEGLAELETMRNTVRQQLLGWQPAGAASEVEFVRGAALGVDAVGAQWWADVYQCEQLICEGDQE